MLDKLTYVSSTNKRIEFGTGNIVIDTNNFRDYEWKYSQPFKRISNFRKDIVTKTLPVLIYREAKETANQIFDIIEEDVILNQYGKLYSGDYYLRGYFIANKKINYTATDILKFDLTFVTDLPQWVKEIPFNYRPSELESGGLDYDYDYLYDYGVGGGIDEITNPSFAPQNMRIMIYGTCTNPNVIINNHSYQIYASLDSNDYAIIDTAEKTITKVYADGTRENIFNSRNRASYIFEKLPSGVNTISVTPETNADIIIIEERSEPKW